MTTKEKLAFELFLKLKPHMPLTDVTKSGYVSAIVQAKEMVDLFLETIKDSAPKAPESPL